MKRVRAVDYHGFLALTMLFGLLIRIAEAQPPAKVPLRGHFLTDSVEIGQPFRYALTYDHAPTADVLFPDKARHFAPFLVQDVAVFTTRTTGTGPQAMSRDSAVYTLVSFSVDSAQCLRVPVRLLNASDCTTLFTTIDTVFLKSQLASARPDTLALASVTAVVPLRQEFNYPVLAIVVVLTGLGGALLYGLFRRPLTRWYGQYTLTRRHIRFLREYNRLSRGINASTAADSANQAVVLWKTYLERLERRPYNSLTTPEIAKRIADERVSDALREADRMIYGGAFSAQSQPALRVLSDVATQTYHRRRDAMKK